MQQTFMALLCKDPTVGKHPSFVCFDSIQRLASVRIFLSISINSRACANDLRTNAVSLLKKNEFQFKPTNAVYLPLNRNIP